MSKYDAATRRAARTALQRSIRDDGRQEGVPRFTAVANSMDIPRSTLRRWWRKWHEQGPAGTDPGTELVLPDDPPPQAEPLELDPDAPRVVFLRDLLVLTSRKLEQASRDGAMTAVAQLAKQVSDVRDDLDEERHRIAEEEDPELSPEQQLNRLRMSLPDWSDDALEEVVAYYLDKKHLPPLDDLAGCWLEHGEVELRALDGGKE